MTVWQTVFLVRIVRPEQRVSGMSRLSSRLFSGLLSRGGMMQTLGRGLPVSVAGGRLVAVLVQASFKDLDLFLQKPVFLF